MPETIVITPPAKNSADEWNAMIREGAAKAGIELPQPGAAAAAAATDPKKEKDDEPTIYEASLTLNGEEITFRGEDPADVLRQYTAAVQAAQSAAAPAAVQKVDEPKPAFTEAELFDISLGIQKGDVQVLENYIEKSGLIDRLLEKRGVKVEQIKEQITTGQNKELVDAWKEATDSFVAKVKAGESDYPGGPQNTYLMGMMLGELGLTDKPSVESFEMAYAELKRRNMVFPVESSTGKSAGATQSQPGAGAGGAQEKKQATSSTAVGTHGTRTGDQRAAIDPSRRFELDLTKLTPREYSESYNELIRAGVKPEQIVIKQ